MKKRHRPEFQYKANLHTFEPGYPYGKSLSRRPQFSALPKAMCQIMRQWQYTKNIHLNYKSNGQLLKKHQSKLEDLQQQHLHVHPINPA